MHFEIIVISLIQYLLGAILLTDWNHMLKLSKKTDYAIILLAHLGEADSSVSAQEIAGLYDLPQPMVANILKQLCVAGLVQSVRGQLGGYILAKSTNAITLAEIINVTDNPFNLVCLLYTSDAADE